MKRIISLLAARAIMAAMFAASAMPAFAFETKSTNSEGNAVGQRESGFTANGTGGKGSTSYAATQGGAQYVGKFFSTAARS